MRRTLTARRLFTPAHAIEYPRLTIEDSAIVRLASRDDAEVPAGRVIDLGDGILAPGFIDLHIHGGAGHDVMEAEAESLAAVERLLFRHGVTSYFPTTVTAPLDTTLRALDRLGSAVENAATEQASTNRARPLGIHLEGPFISHARRGVHPPADLLPPRIETFEKFWKASRGQIRIMTIAPELEGARELIEQAAKRGVCVSLGHSDASLDDARRGVAAGARHATHTFNAMRPLDHRDPGILGAVLTDDRVSADVIADGIHLDPAVLKLFLRAKGPDHAVLITDAIAATGMPDGRYRLGSFEVDVKDGRCTAGGKLAGSVLTMDRAVRNVMQFSEWDLQSAIRLATANPAQTAKIDALRGSIAPGLAADLVVLDAHGNVRTTIVGGEIN